MFHFYITTLVTVSVFLLTNRLIQCALIDDDSAKNWATLFVYIISNTAYIYKNNNISLGYFPGPIDAVVIQSLKIIPSRSLTFGRREDISAYLIKLKKENPDVFKSLENDFKYIEYKLLTNFYHGSLFRDLSDPSTIKNLAKHIVPNRQLSMIAYAIKKRYGDDTWKSFSNINSIKGIICGFNIHDLERIEPDHFLLINEEVFVTLWECTKLKLKALLSVASKPEVYGSPQGWTEDIVYKMGFVMSVIPNNIMRTMQPSSFYGLNHEIFKFLSYKAWKMEMTKEQIRSMPEKAKVAWLIYNKDTSVFFDNDY